MSINVTATAEIAGDGESYTRWAGTVTGGIDSGDGAGGEEVYEGVAVFEQFVLF